MSESAVILEGEVARRFNPVDKLRATNQDSSVSDWVPSDTLDLGSLMASENTLYLANIDDDCDAYEEVEVDVSTDLEDADDETKNTHKITGTGSDGNDYAVGLDENGNLTSEMVPSAIHIVIKPRKLEYKEGETLDFTGIHVYLMDGNNQRFTSEDYPTGEIPFDELVFPVTIADGISIDSVIGEWGGKTVEAYVNYWTELDTSPLEGYEARAWCSVHSLFVNAGGVSYWLSEQQGEKVDYYYGSGREYKTTMIPYVLRYGGKEKTIYWIGGPSEYYSVSPWPPETELGNSLEHIIYALFVNGREAGGINIPVQWTRSDGEMLEDNFSITVKPKPSTESNNSTSDSGSGHTSGGF